MTAEIIDGRAVSQAIRDELRARVSALRDRGVVPGLAFILVGENPASLSYVQGKSQACEEVGIFSETIHLAADATSTESLTGLVRDVNADPRFHGMIIQLPLPDHIDPVPALHAMDPDKDADGLHPLNLGRLLAGEPGPRPATPAGIQQMLVRSGYDPAGKHVVILGRSNLVGKPLAALLMQKAPGANATVTVCHTGTADVGAEARRADILVAAMGSPRFVTAEMVREGAVVIDVGTNRVEDPTRKRGWRLVGDVDFEAVARKAAAITPVPGGVGPMTVTMLLANTVHLAGG